MHFVELAVQNVRGFSPAGRFALKTGYFVLKPPTAELSPLAGVVARAALRGRPRRGRRFSASAQKPGKGALTFVGQDALTYRVLRELGGAGDRCTGSTPPRSSPSS